MKILSPVPVTKFRHREDAGACTVPEASAEHSYLLAKAPGVALQEPPSPGSCRSGPQSRCPRSRLTAGRLRGNMKDQPGGNGWGGPAPCEAPHPSGSCPFCLPMCLLFLFLGKVLFDMISTLIHCFFLFFFFFTNVSILPHTLLNLTPANP